MTTGANERRALATIRRCIALDRIAVTRHFRVRLTERGMLWADVLAVFDAPTEVLDRGVDDVGRPRWIVRGKAANGQVMAAVCAIGRDAMGDLVVFITAFWETKP